jgi:hypothetical protein
MIAAAGSERRSRANLRATGVRYILPSPVAGHAPSRRPSAVKTAPITAFALAPCFAAPSVVALVRAVELASVTKAAKENDATALFANALN